MERANIGGFATSKLMNVTLRQVIGSETLKKVCLVFIVFVNRVILRPFSTDKIILFLYSV
jgi:hypothetical protein